MIDIATLIACGINPSQARLYVQPLKETCDLFKINSKARIAAFRQKQQQAETELANRERTLQSTQAHVQQQLATRVVQIAEQSRARRQASAVIAKSALMAADPASDITGEVLAALNQQLPSVSVTPLPQQAQPQSQPQGR